MLHSSHQCSCFKNAVVFDPNSEATPTQSEQPQQLETPVETPVPTPSGTPVQTPPIETDQPPMVQPTVSMEHSTREPVQDVQHQQTFVYRHPDTTTVQHTSSWVEAPVFIPSYQHLQPYYEQQHHVPVQSYPQVYTVPAPYVHQTQEMPVQAMQHQYGYPQPSQDVSTSHTSVGTMSQQSAASTSSDRKVRQCGNDFSCNDTSCRICHPEVNTQFNHIYKIVKGTNGKYQVQCPYIDSHKLSKINERNIQKHFNKCRNNVQLSNPAKVKEWRVCRNNSAHHVFHKFFREHMKSCNVNNFTQQRKLYSRLPKNHPSVTVTVGSKQEYFERKYGMSPGDILKLNFPDEHQCWKLLKLHLPILN